MKKRFPLFLCLYLSVSCISLAPEGENDCLESDSGPIAVRSGSVVEPSDPFFVSQKMAELFISSRKENPEIISIEPYEMDGVVCLYVINFEKGYKIVSADTRIQPILAECDEGSLYPEETDNPGQKVWLEDTADRIRVLKRYKPTVKEDYSDLWTPYKAHDDSFVMTRAMTRDSLWLDEEFIWIRVLESSSQTLYSHANQSALMTTKWGQEYPWNVKMPDDYVTDNPCLTGCAAVAISQVLRYFNKRGNYPTDLWHTVSVSSTTPHYYSYTLGGNTYYRVYVTTTLSKSGYTSNSSRWGNMPDTRNGSYTKYVSRLMLDIGNRVNMFYSEFDSHVIGDTLQYTIPNLSQCGISSSYAPFNFSQVAANINMQWPVIISAFTSPDLPREGHVWVIDGCHDFSYDYTTIETFYCISPDDYYSYSNVVDIYTCDEMMYNYPNVYNGMQTVTHSNHTSKNLHMNWGWDGNGDGYYDMLNSDDWLYSEGNTTANYLYTRCMHYNISTSQLN